MDLNKIVSGNQALLSEPFRWALIKVVESDFPNGTISFPKDVMWVVFNDEFLITGMGDLITIFLVVALRENCPMTRMTQTFDEKYIQIFSDEWQHFLEFQEKGIPLRGIPKFSEIFYREFPFHSTFLSECQEFWIEWFALRRLSKLRISPFRNFRNFSTIESALNWVPL